MKDGLEWESSSQAVYILKYSWEWPENILLFFPSMSRPWFARGSLWGVPWRLGCHGSSETALPKTPSPGHWRKKEEIQDRKTPPRVFAPTIMQPKCTRLPILYLHYKRVIHAIFTLDGLGESFANIPMELKAKEEHGRYVAHFLHETDHCWIKQSVWTTLHLIIQAMWLLISCCRFLSKCPHISRSRYNATKLTSYDRTL